MPPDTRRRPPSASVSASTAQFLTICRCSLWNSSLWAMRRHTALAAMTCMSGPPCMPGNTARSIASAYSARHMMMPARGPVSVLCVVLVTTSQYGTGLGCTPAAMSPAMCAMSAMSSAPHSSAISRKAAKSTMRGYAL